MIYVASRVRHAPMWRALRQRHPIRASWIDEAGAGESPSLPDLWERVINEVRTSTALVFYVEPDDLPLKGAYIEAGAALLAGVPVFACFPAIPLEPDTYRPIGSWIRHPLVTISGTLGEALVSASRASPD